MDDVLPDFAAMSVEATGSTCRTSFDGFAYEYMRIGVPCVARRIVEQLTPEAWALLERADADWRRSLLAGVMDYVAETPLYLTLQDAAQHGIPPDLIYMTPPTSDVDEAVSASMELLVGEPDFGVLKEAAAAVQRGLLSLFAPPYSEAWNKLCVLDFLAAEVEARAIDAGRLPWRAAERACAICGKTALEPSDFEDDEAPAPWQRVWARPQCRHWAHAACVAHAAGLLARDDLDSLASTARVLVERALRASPSELTCATCGVPLLECRIVQM